MRAFRLIALFCLFFATSSAFTQNRAELPRVVRFSGVLTNHDGSPRTGTVGVTFAIYSSQDGTAPLWQEVQNVALDETGHYSILLGAAKAEGLPAELFATNDARWLGIRIESEQEQPRTILAAVPYAMKAGDAETLGGKPLSAFVLNDTGTKGRHTEGAAANDANARSNSMFQPLPTTLAGVSGTGTAGYHTKWTDGSGTLANSLVYDNGTNVGIGTTSPLGTLHVYGANAPSSGGSSITGDLILQGVGGTFGGAMGSYDNGVSQYMWFQGRYTDSAVYRPIILNPSGGFVGIGTTTPLGTLHMQGPNAIEQGQTAANGAFIIQGAGTFANVFGTYDNGQPGGQYAWIQPRYMDNAVYRALVLNPSGGNVGIGTTSPGAALDVVGHINASGNVVAANNIWAQGGLIGNGSAITQLSASALSGTIASTNLSGTYSNALTLSNASNSFTGSGAGLTSLNASNLATGTVPSAVVNGTYSNALTLSNASNSFSGSGAGLTALKASNLASGTVPSAVVSGTYSNALTLSSTSNVLYGDGSHLTGVSASSLTGGTYANAYTFSNASNSFAGSGASLTSVNAVSLNGVAAANYARTDQANSLTGNQAIAGSVSVRTSSYEQTNLDTSGNLVALGSLYVGPGNFVAPNGTDVLTAQVTNGSTVSNIFRVDSTGKGYFNGGTAVGGADFAESFDVLGSADHYEPGDVLVIDPTGHRRMALSQTPYSTLVSGIYSTKPGVLGTPHTMDEQKLVKEVPLAVVGVVPCKVSAENGPIAVGDLLVTSATPGYAMHGTDRSKMLGAVVGKALEPLVAGKGVIQVLVTLQ